MEDRWLRLIGPGVISVGLLAALGPTAIAPGNGTWDPAPCVGGGIARIAAALDNDTSRVNEAAVDPWFTLDPVLDASGSLVGQRLTLASGPSAAPRRLELPVETFVAGPYGHIVIVGDDDGRRSRLRVLDLIEGCAWWLADESAVVRRAALSPDRVTIHETRVDRATRADLGLWQRPMDGHARATRIAAPLDPDARFGRTWSTELAWSVEGDRLAVQSCGALACRTRVLDPTSGAQELIADPSLGVMIGVSADRVVAYQACRGLPCGLVAVDIRTRHRTVLSDAAGDAAILGRGPAARVVHERFDRDARRLRVIDVDGRHAHDLGAIPDGVAFRGAIDDLNLPADEDSR